MSDLQVLGARDWKAILNFCMYVMGESDPQNRRRVYTKALRAQMLRRTASRCNATCVSFAEYCLIT